MTLNKEELYHGGKILKLHGFKGEIIVGLNSPNADDYTELKIIFIEIHHSLVPYFIEKLEILNHDSIKLKLADVNSTSDAKPILKAEIFIRQEDITEMKFRKSRPNGMGPVNHRDVVEENLRLISGFKVLDDMLGDLGVVEEIIELPNNPLIRVVNDDREFLIPLNKHIVLKIDSKKKVVQVSVPDGLVDL
ncbi:MAG: hypothetical protein SH856_06180 [Flavobacteriales bacterium]|nr:hypothetical protein [Flavobacteriales bacterium]